MPQLDVFTFTPVVTWLVITISLFYNILLVSGLSRIYKILLYRKKQLNYYNKVKEILEKEVYYIVKINNKFFVNFSKLYKFTPQISNIFIEKSLENKKDFLLKEINFYKNWLETYHIGIELYSKQLLHKIINKDI